MKVIFPEYWIWLLGIPLSIGILFLVYKRVALITETWFSSDEYERSYPMIKFGLRVAGFVLLFMALVGPYWGEKEGESNLLGREIFILLDVSASMNAEDIKPSRLEKAKRELKMVINHLDGDKVGLILFTESAYVQCPLTHDRQAVSLFLDLAETRQFAQTGTQYRSALATAMDRFLNGSPESANTSRGIILVSDGEDFGDTYASLIERLKQSDVRVFPVGVGTYEGAPIPQFVNNKKKGYKRFEDGTVAISRLIDDDLQNLANEFGTRYIRLSNPTESLSELEKDIDDLASSPLDTQVAKVKNNKFQVFLFFSVMSLFVSLFLMPIRKV